MSIYDELKAAGVPMGNHESDLYVPATPQVLAILGRYPMNKANASRFRNQCPPNEGEIWLDIPFAYLPFWDRVAARL